MRQCYKSENGIQPQPNYYFGNSRSCNEKVGECFCIYPNRNTRPATVHFKLDNTQAYSGQAANFLSPKLQEILKNSVPRKPNHCHNAQAVFSTMLIKDAIIFFVYVITKLLWNQYSTSLKLFESVCA